MSTRKKDIENESVENEAGGKFPATSGSTGKISKKNVKKDISDSDGKETRHRRKKKSAGKGLAELLKRKNEMLLDMKNKLEQSSKAFEIKDDKMLRMAAEFDNFKKRTRREWELHEKKANARLLNEILGVLDDFDRAFASDGDTGDHFQSGIRMIYDRLVTILKSSGLSEIESEGVRFDPQYHEAMGDAESDEVEPGCILHIVQKGYMINGQLLRPARVIVARVKK